MNRRPAAENSMEKFLIQDYIESGLEREDNVQRSLFELIWVHPAGQYST